MILSKEVTIELKTMKSVKFWVEKGYSNLHPGQKLTVPIELLSHGARAEIIYKCDNCETTKKAKWHNISGKNIHLCYDCKQKKTCAHMNKVHSRKYPTKEQHWNWNTNRQQSRDFYFYAKKCRKITEENYNKYKYIINPKNLPRTRCGVENGYQLDHVISVKWGFLHGLNPKIVGSLANLQMLSWEKNIKKGA